MLPKGAFYLRTRPNEGSSSRFVASTDTRYITRRAPLDERDNRPSFHERACGQGSVPRPCPSPRAPVGKRGGDGRDSAGSLRPKTSSGGKEIVAHTGDTPAPLSNHSIPWPAPCSEGENTNDWAGERAIPQPSARDSGAVRGGSSGAPPGAQPQQGVGYAAPGRMRPRNRAGGARRRAVRSVAQGKKRGISG